MPVAVALAACLVLAGCTGEVPVEPTPAPTTAPSPTATPTPEAITPPERPAEMDRNDDVGAMAAGEYFMRLFSYVMRTGDVEEWDAISGQTCEFCASIRALAADTYSAGGRFTGGETTLGVPEILKFDESLAAYAVAIDFAIEGGEELDAAGREVREMPAETGRAVLDVAPSARSWVLLEGSSSEESDE